MSELSLRGDTFVDFIMLGNKWNILPAIIARQRYISMITITDRIEQGIRYHIYEYCLSTNYVLMSLYLIDPLWFCGNSIWCGERVSNYRYFQFNVSSCGVESHRHPCILNRIWFV